MIRLYGHLLEDIGMCWLPAHPMGDRPRATWRGQCPRSGTCTYLVTDTSVRLQTGKVTFCFSAGALKGVLRVQGLRVKPLKIRRSEKTQMHHFLA